MTDRHRRLLKYTYKKDEKLPRFEQDYPLIIEGKTEITAKFSTMQLEELLYNSTKNVA